MSTPSFEGHDGRKTGNISEKLIITVVVAFIFYN